QVNAAHILLKFDISAMTLDNLKQASTLFSYDAQDNGFSAAIDSHKVESGIQEWTVPVTGIYRIEASGAQGGSGCGISSGLGAKISGDFGLRKGSILLIGIGQTGSNGDDGTQSPGGGGGSFIAQGENNATAIPLIIAGGGGGVCKGTTGPDYYETHGRIQKDGGDVNDSEKIYGGVDGSGGKKGGESNDSGSGAGFFSNAGLGSDEYNGVAQGFRSLYPLLGGVNSNNYGGFGGGGGGSNDRGDMDKGGGGGYSGGANAYDYSKGAGGGGSYNSGSNQDNESGVNVGHGKVVITYLQEPSILITNVQVRQEDFEVIITYDMEGELQGKDGVMLAYSTDDGQTYKPISDADGDLGKYVKSGSGRKISFLINAGYAGGNASFEVFVSSTPLGSPWTFSNAGATGRLGPTQTLVNTAYSGSSLEGDVTITTQGIQEWSVPAGGTYTIEAWGAQGGTSSSRSGGSGAKMKGDFILQDKDILNILIGQMGEDLGDCNTGGGGGTFVWDNKESPMIISGGGGGAGDTYNGNNGIITGNGTTANPSGGSPGTNGKGANPGGAGWYSNGREFEGAKGGTRPLNNGTGGSAGTSETGDGGFGGGSGGTGNDCSSHGSGGGGGYSGGAGQGADSYGGGGGGSYNAGTNQDNKSGINTGHGKVVITYVQGASETTIAISGVSSTIEFNGVEDIAGERNPELFLPKDEFETTPEYDQRVAQKEALIKGLRTQIITDQKVRIKERARLAAERAVEFERQLQVKITESLVPVEFTPSGLDRYDADKGTFPLTVNGQTYTVAIPRSEARSFKVNYTTAKVEGFKQLQRDLETYNYFDMVVIHPITGSRFPLGSTEAAAKEIILAEEVDLTGMWNLTYDWNCDDESTQSTVTFNADRTGKIGDYVITWGASISAISLGPGKCDDSINFDYNAYYKFDSGTTYYFLVDGDVASGIMDSGGDGTVDGINSMVRK
ncbi:MAG: hypothetical protein HOK52_01120, partial [Candidatus Marinimicrobia bacterium]|nr:hypothetical protein [Candidatus Neomarinimicrobiota bacterium]MBT3962020.1 hypothetical protein [Candidatus Neomarinimicrobiota bacterium]MBT4382388.1 hypothetical protein [Candidatus Neomarinimicrobiota bacterium]MBT4636505.1 hypothetical protein [Candidatus Neomarinimicrobiota bacterium]MBT4734560.1 hypothetical protein [Candidatus Neomarinimicrobiota bacterium]